MDIYPGPTPANLACLPQALTQRTQWVLWQGVDRLDTVTGLIKLNKIPVNAHGLTPADTTDARTWSTYQACVDALGVALEEWELADPGAYRGGGLGYVLADDDPYTGIDLDRCVDLATGGIAPWAQTYVDALASYTEITPSGTGLHILVEGSLPPKGRRKGQVEMYDQWRFFTMTGWHLPHTPQTITACQVALTACWCRLFAPDVGQPVWLLDAHGAITNATGIPWVITHVSAAPSGELFAHFAETRSGWPWAQCERAPALPLSTGTAILPDEDVITKACAAHNGDKVKRLAAGHWQQEYDSQSEADLALCCLLAFWSRDQGQLDRLFRTTGLFREKWDEKRGATTYGQRTVSEALARQTEMYTPAGAMVLSAHVPHAQSGMPTTGGAQVWGAQVWGAPGPDLHFVDLADMLKKTYPLPRWLIKDLIPEGLTFLVGKPKSSKTYLAYSLALSLVMSMQSARPWLDHYDISNKGPVVYITLEDSEAESWRRVMALEPGLTGLLSGQFIFHHGMDFPYLGPELVTVVREKVIEAYHPTLIVLDPISYLYAPTKKGADQFADVKNMLLPLRWLATEHHVSILGVDHRRKESADDVDIFESTYGSNAKIAVADALLMIVRDAKEILIHTKVRQAEEQTITLELTFDDLGRATWEWKGAVGGLVSQGQYGDLRQRVIETLSGFQQPMSMPDILAALNIPDSKTVRNNIFQILFRAQRSGEVQKTTRGQYVWAGGI